MNIQTATFVLLLALAACVTATAGEIYKRVNEDGVVEYSDTPYPDAEQIEVNPNVIEMRQVPRREPTTSAAVPSAAEPESSSSTETVERLERAEPPRLENEVNREAAVP